MNRLGMKMPPDPLPPRVREVARSLASASSPKIHQVFWISSCSTPSMNDCPDPSTSGSQILRTEKTS
jgi:hypothetical protein